MTDPVKNFNPALDLKLERVVDVPRELVWKAWTTPAHLKKWFTPRPWQTIDCVIDLRPGGAFLTVIQGPEGEKMTHVGCYLEIIENEKLVWTDALEADFRPAAAPNDCFESFFTANNMLEPHERGTRYTVIAMHSSEEARRKHDEQGFRDGWGTALDQLVEMMKAM